MSAQILQSFKEVVDEERTELLEKKRAGLKNTASAEGEAEDEAWFADEQNRFGIALSGGGIRSATVSLGFLQALNECDLLRKADYLSTVSGGGYLGGYVQARLFESRHNRNPYADLFKKEDIDHLREHRRYLAAGKSRWTRIGNRLKLFTATVVSTILNWVWVLALAAILYYAIKLATTLLVVETGLSTRLPYVTPWLVSGGLGLLAFHYFTLIRAAPGGYKFTRFVGKLWNSDGLIVLETIVLMAGALFALVLWMGGDSNTVATDLKRGSIAFLVLVVGGFAGNPNLITMHRYYRDRLADAFLGAASKKSRRLKLHQLKESVEKGAPFPLFNACLNLAADVAARGKTSDFFVLSPLRVGCDETGYSPTQQTVQYRPFPVSTAIASSGAAVNPSMGVKSSPVGAFFMTLLNLRTGQWVDNPRKRRRKWKWTERFDWWPGYQVAELFRRTTVKRRRVQISDGGHIENLGVFELLRRQCRLIVSLDAGADPDFRFSDLANLVRRAREELGVTIDFLQSPENSVRPAASSAYAKSQFALARIGTLPGSPVDGYTGLLVYAKSSLRARRRFETERSARHTSYAYKSNHPQFPHESTVDQFFDTAQWEAYYYLGRFMAFDVLGQRVREDGKGATVQVHSMYKSLAALDDEEKLYNYLP